MTVSGHPAIQRHLSQGERRTVSPFDVDSPLVPLVDRHRASLGDQRNDVPALDALLLVGLGAGQPSAQPDPDNEPEQP
jgi:hypothetical protein